MSELTIVMYHYVRDLKRSRYPEIKGRSVEEFRNQLDFFDRNYVVVTVEEILSAISGAGRLPSNALWLTFDDGYLDHYTNVFPLLFDRRWQGSFFPPVSAILHGELLDVNKVHFLLATSGNRSRLIGEIQDFVESHSAKDIRPFDEYWEDLAVPSRLDSGEVMFIKRMLQHALPAEVRLKLIDTLFAKHVSADSSAFASELYVSTDQLRTMISCGMHVGSHGDTHYRLSLLEPARQALEIDNSIKFMKRLGVPTDQWVMCYPYGAYDQSVIGILKDRSCAVALTTRIGVARLKEDDPFALPRIDTNDFPVS